MDYQIMCNTLMNTKSQIISKQSHKSTILNNNTTFPIYSQYATGIG